jgi:hypothetical protein
MHQEVAEVCGWGKQETTSTWRMKDCQEHAAFGAMVVEGCCIMTTGRQEKKGILTLVYGVMKVEDRGAIKMRGHHSESGGDRA